MKPTHPCTDCGTPLTRTMAARCQTCSWAWMKATAPARTAVARALKDGILNRKPCEVCGKAEAEAHHDDYSKPLVVRWLCRQHHRHHHIAAQRRYVAATQSEPTQQNECLT